MDREHRAETATPAIARASSIGCLFVLTLVCTAMTLLLDVMLWRHLGRQLESLRFIPGDGTITRCRTLTTGKGDNETAKLDVEYTYVVDGVSYLGKRVCPSEWTFHDEIRRFVAEHPAGSAVTVYHDPIYPWTAVLQPGLVGEHLFLLHFSLPFNAAMAGLWLSFVTRPFANGLTRLRLDFGFRVIERDQETRVRLPRVTPLGAAFSVAFCVPIVLQIAVALATLGNPPLAIASAMLVVSLASIVGTYLVFRQRLTSGCSDLIIDRGQKTLSLPLTFGRESRLVFSLDDLIGVVAVDHVWQDDDPTRVYRVVVRWRASAGTTEEAVLMQVSSQEDAELIAEAIRSRIDSYCQPAT